MSHTKHNKYIKNHRDPYANLLSANYGRSESGSSAAFERPRGRACSRTAVDLCLPDGSLPVDINDALQNGHCCDHFPVLKLLTLENGVGIGYSNVLHTLKTDVAGWRFAKISIG